SRLKERSQLHRILADNNTWLFGEEFSLTVDDQSLTEVLRKHLKLIGEDTAIDRPVTRIDGKRGIVDLMLSRSVPQNRAEEREHLIVELKRPTVKIGSAEITQVKNYAFAVAEDERFEALKTRWSFWVISNAFKQTGKREARQSDRPKGQVYKDGKIEVWCKTWGEVLEEAKSRMKFVEDHLKANIDKEASLKYLQQTYDKYLSGVVEEVNESEGEENAVS
ncbi:MAG: DNA mismatch repair protein, partial [Pseudomonadota bacterium]